MKVRSVTKWSTYRLMFAIFLLLGGSVMALLT